VTVEQWGDIQRWCKCRKTADIDRRP